MPSAEEQKEMELLRDKFEKSEEVRRQQKDVIYSMRKEM